MTIADMRALLALGDGVSDAAVLEAYAAYLTGANAEPPGASPATLRLRYPAFANVADATIAYWLADAARIVTPAWGADEEPGTLALAAHNMALAKVPGMAQDAAAQIPAGVTRFRSASMDVGISEAAANRAAIGGYAATPYGVEFQVMLRRNVGGPRLVGGGCARGYGIGVGYEGLPGYGR